MRSEQLSEVLATKVGFASPFPRWIFPDTPKSTGQTLATFQAACVVTAFIDFCQSHDTSCEHVMPDFFYDIPSRNGMETVGDRQERIEAIASKVRDTLSANSLPIAVRAHNGFLSLSFIE